MMRSNLARRSQGTSEEKEERAGRLFQAQEAKLKELEAEVQELEEAAAQAAEQGGHQAPHQPASVPQVTHTDNRAQITQLPPEVGEKRKAIGETEPRRSSNDKLNDKEQGGLNVKPPTR
jgi:hypothetical protein